MKLSTLPAALAAAALLCAPHSFAVPAPASKDSAPSIPRPAFPAELPQTKNIDAKLAAGLHFSLPAPHLDILPMPGPAAAEVTILGEPTATEEQMLACLLARNPKPKLTGSPKELVHAYYEEAEREGIRPDVAFAQALKETGFFRYGGTVTSDQNNYCGLGTTSATVKGAYFSTSELGVRAHIQHLLAYASTRRPVLPVVDPRYDLVRSTYGARTLGTWTDLNGRWAVPGHTYGQSIMQLFRDILRQ